MKDILFERLTALDVKSRECSVHAEKLACERLPKYPEHITFHAQNDGGVSVICEHHNMSWEVNFLPNGRFSLQLNMNGSSDGRIRRVLRAIGEIYKHKKTEPSSPT